MFKLYWGRPAPANPGDDLCHLLVHLIGGGTSFPLGWLILPVLVLVVAGRASTHVSQANVMLILLHGPAGGFWIMFTMCTPFTFSRERNYTNGSSEEH